MMYWMCEGQGQSSPLNFVHFHHMHHDMILNWVLLITLPSGIGLIKYLAQMITMVRQQAVSNNHVSCAKVKVKVCKTPLLISHFS